MGEPDVKTRVALLGGSTKSVPRPSRSYAMHCGLLPSDLLNASQQSTISYDYLSKEDIKALILSWSSKQTSDSEAPDADDLEGLLENMYLTEAERSRIKDLAAAAPNINEVYRVLNRFGTRSQSNRIEVSLQIFSGASNPDAHPHIPAGAKQARKVAAQARSQGGPRRRQGAGASQAGGQRPAGTMAVRLGGRAPAARRAHPGPSRHHPRPGGG